MHPIKFYIFILIVLFFSSGAVAQKLHSPKEVEQYMKKSLINYQIDSVDIIFESVSFPIIETGQFLVSNEEEIQIQQKKFHLSRKAKKARKKARKAAQKNNFPKAQKLYEKAIKKAPDHSELIQEFADFYWGNNKIEEMILLEEKEIEANPIDFIAYAKLASAYQSLGNKEKALEYIITAHLYNRNNIKITQKLIDIFRENKMHYQNHTFYPEYKIENTDGKILIQAKDAPWRSYAGCKALWQNEETYREEMKHLANVNIDKIEQKECLLNALISYNKMKTGKENFPLLEILGASLKKGSVDDFILYEIELRQNPNLIHFLSKEKIDRIIHYLKTTRLTVNEEL